MNAAAVEPQPAPSGWMIVFGENVSSCVTSVRFFASRFAPEYALIASGVSCSFSSRKRDVTTISSGPWSCAKAGGAPHANAPNPRPTPARQWRPRPLQRFFMIVSPSVSEHCVQATAAAKAWPSRLTFPSNAKPRVTVYRTIEQSDKLPNVSLPRNHPGGCLLVWVIGAFAGRAEDVNYVRVGAVPC